jgi:hypothetical protein
MEGRKDFLMFIFRKINMRKFRIKKTRPGEIVKNHPSKETS